MHEQVLAFALPMVLGVALLQDARVAAQSSPGTVASPKALLAEPLDLTPVDNRQAEAHRLLQQGLDLFDRQQFSEAVTSWERALEIYREIGDREGEVTTIGNLSFVYFTQGNYSQAQDYLEQALPLLRERQDFRVAATLRNLAAIYQAQGCYSEAESFLLEALSISREQLGENHPDVAANLNNLASLYQDQGRYSEAEPRYQQALEIYRQQLGENHPDVANGLSRLGNLYQLQGRYGEAESLFLEALEIAREQLGERHPDVANNLSHLGNIYRLQGRYREAEPLLQQALEIEQEQLGTRHPELGNRLNNLGDLYLAQGRFGDYQRAIDYYEQSLQIALEFGNRRSESIVLGDLGNAYYSLGKYRESIEYHEQARRIALEIGDPQGEANALSSLGNIYAFLGEYQPAIEYHQQHLDLARALGDRRGEANALNNLGEAYRALGDFSQAMDFYQHSLNIATEESYFQGVSNALGNISLVHFERGDYQLAVQYSKDSLKIKREYGLNLGIINSLNNLGLLNVALEKFEEALAFYQEGMSIAEEIEDLNALATLQLNRGIVHRALGEYEVAVELLGQSHSVFRALENRASEGTTLANIGKLFSERNYPKLAIIFLKASVEVREAIRGELRGLERQLQQSFTQTIADDYRLLADLLLQQNRIIEAQAILDLLKVQELDDYLRGVQSHDNRTPSVDYLRPEDAILERYNELQQSAIAAGRELADLKAIPQTERTDAQVQRIAQLTNLLDDINGDFRNFARSPEIRASIERLGDTAREASLSLNNLDRLRDELSQLNAAIFYPLILEDRLELVITTPTSPPLRRTVPVSRQALNQSILAFREALTSLDPNIEVPAQQLYDWLIRPLEADLAEAQVNTIIYSPDGQLRYIPLAALHDGEQWLVERYRVNNITAESLTDLTETDATQVRILGAAFANENLVHTPEVNGKTYTFRGLPGAGLEVETLPTDIKLLDEAFSLAAVRPIMDEYTVLHFATHAAFVSGVPEDSFILFGNGDTATLRDVAAWSLNGVDLVVLSACETGVGGLGDGEEILGLGYQFQLSGAKAVMSSLWTVSDRGTQVLMGAFYDALEQSTTKAAALQAAQIALVTGNLNGEAGGLSAEVMRAGAPPTLREGVEIPVASGYSHPYYWASFILIGNGL